MKLIVATICCFLIVTCAEGNSQKKIFGDNHNARGGQFPYQVSLQLFGNHFCGGSILNPTTILTACHCFYNESQAVMEWKASATTVFVGSIDKNEGSSYKVNQLKCHDDYQPLYLSNNIALLKLESEILFSENVRPTKLPTSNIADGKILTASGWGMIYDECTLKHPKNEIYLQFLEVTIKNSKECLKILERLNYHFNPGSMLCGKAASSSFRPQGLCAGDSGGPLVADSIQYGIVLRGYQVCASKVPDVFTNVFRYIDWIQKEMLFSPNYDYYD